MSDNPTTPAKPKTPFFKLKVRTAILVWVPLAGLLSLLLLQTLMTMDIQSEFRNWRYRFALRHANDSERIEILREIFSKMKLSEWDEIVFDCMDDVEKPLISMLDSTDKDIRIDACAAIGWCGNDPAAIPGLLRNMNDFPYLVMVWFERYGWKSAEVLLPILSTSPEHVQLEIVRTLGYIHNRSAVEPIIPFLKSTNAEMRRAAACTLGYLYDLRAVDGLKALLDDPDESVQSDAKGALWKIQISNPGTKFLTDEQINGPNGWR